MLNNSTQCKDCVKQDVCSIKTRYNFAVESVSQANTTLEANSIHYVKDNNAITVSITCKKFIAISAHR